MPLINSSESYREYHERVGENRHADRPLPKLVVVLPALNEEMTIVDVIDRIPRDIPGVGLVDVVVVDDGSTDRTVERALKRDAVVVSHPINLGVGAAVATGLDAALRLGADLIVSMDSDGQFRPEDIPLVIQPVLEEGYGLVVCSRYARRELIPEMPWIKKYGGIVLSQLVNTVIWGGGFTDVLCGFRAYSRDTALRLNLYSRFTYTQESLIDAAAKGVRMTEVSVKVRGEREFGKSRVVASLLVYAAQAMTILARAIRDTRPLMFFGVQALVFMVVGLLGIGTSIILADSRGPLTIATGMIFSSASLIVGSLIMVLTLIADQLGRIKRLHETTLYMARLEFYRHAPPLPRGRRVMRDPRQAEVESWRRG